MTDEQQLRAIIDHWVRATKEGRKDDVLANHAHDLVVFDPLPPLAYTSAADYRKSFDIWWPETAGDAPFELSDLTFTLGDTAAFAHALLHCGGTHPDGESFEDTVRVTLCFQKRQGRWWIVHQHTSAPMDIEQE